MKSALFIFAAACLLATPSLAATPAGAPFQVAGAEVHVGPGPDHRDRWREHREGCREVTIRERHGDSTVVRHIRRCD